MAALLPRETTGLLIVDVQERLYPHVERPCEILESMQKAIRGFQILKLPIVAVEHCPDKLGNIVKALKNLLDNQDHQHFVKTAFSCMGDPQVKKFILSSPIQNWILIGLEAHICVLQTAKELIAAKKNCVVLNDAISSRSIYDFSTAIAEMRDLGVRISSTETVLYELLKDSREKEFKEICALVKQH